MIDMHERFKKKPRVKKPVDDSHGEEFYYPDRAEETINEASDRASRIESAPTRPDSFVDRDSLKAYAKRLRESVTKAATHGCLTEMRIELPSGKQEHLRAVVAERTLGIPGVAQVLKLTDKGFEVDALIGARVIRGGRRPQITVIKSKL
jgi:hypothetical protein